MYLLEQGVEESQIIENNYEKYIYDNLKDAESLHNHISGKIDDNKRMYFLIDEVQENI